jgi:hypothetical protein
MSNPLPYSVSLFGSHPDEGNDDCHTGDDFATLEEARAAFSNPFSHFSPAEAPTAAYIMLDGPDVHEIRANPEYVAPVDGDDGEDEWRRERAMQAGMAFGCDGYNDEMGW